MRGEISRTPFLLECRFFWFSCFSNQHSLCTRYPFRYFPTPQVRHHQHIQLSIAHGTIFNISKDTKIKPKLLNSTKLQTPPQQIPASNTNLAATKSQNTLQKRHLPVTQAPPNHRSGEPISKQSTSFVRLLRNINPSTRSL